MTQGLSARGADAADYRCSISEHSCTKRALMRQEGGGSPRLCVAARVTRFETVAHLMKYDKQEKHV